MSMIIVINSSNRLICLFFVSGSLNGILALIYTAWITSSILSYVKTLTYSFIDVSYSPFLMYKTAQASITPSFSKIAKHSSIGKYSLLTYSIANFLYFFSQRIYTSFKIKFLNLSDGPTVLLSYPVIRA